MQTFGAADAWAIGHFSRCVVEEVSTQFPSHIPRDSTFYILGALFFILIVQYILKVIGVGYV